MLFKFIESPEDDKRKGKIKTKPKENIFSAEISLSASAVIKALTQLLSAGDVEN
jgi:hypothetical protein